MKPILFNTEMVRAILEDRKTVTRRVVKLKYSNTHLEMRTDKYGTRLIEIENEIPGVTRVKNPDGTITLKVRAFIDRVPPYRPGDILYVRETWTQDGDVYRYKAGFYDQSRKWHPSIHMPREAARIFLRVTDVRVERVQEIAPEQLRAEGFPIFVTPSECKNSFNRFGAVCDYKNKLEKFSDLWDSTIKKADINLYGWDANPWVWVIEFGRISREEAEK